MDKLSELLFHVIDLIKKRKQLAYKPGSVLRVILIASVIYLCRPLPTGYSGLPSGSGEQPSGTGIHDLATPGTHSSWCHHPTGELLPHLLTLTFLADGGYFLLRFPCRRRQLAN